jgi:hypothetical protein
MRSLPTLLLALVLCACSRHNSGDSVPEFVYLRTQSVVVTVTIRADQRVTVGEWLRLRATRAITGEWQKIPFRELPAGTPWIGYVPPERENEVAGNLHWFAQPSDGVLFDAWAPKPVGILERAVKFARPGTYRLWATSHAPIDTTSNSLMVEVLPK